jgi:hypothetical protein
MNQGVLPMSSMAWKLKIAGQAKKKPTKVAVRKMAREARWQQRVSDAQPGNLYDSPANGKSAVDLEETRDKQEKADK